MESAIDFIVSAQTKLHIKIKFQAGLLFCCLYADGGKMNLGTNEIEFDI